LRNFEELLWQKLHVGGGINDLEPFVTNPEENLKKTVYREFVMLGKAQSGTILGVKTIRYIELKK
jgi:hypothetical protein